MRDLKLEQRFDVRPVVDDRDETKHVAALFRQVWPGSHVARADYLHWLYFRNPKGSIVGFNAWHGSELAAHYAVIPIRARLGDAEVNGGLALDIATDLRFRHRGLFARLAEATHERARQLGFNHIVAVANANSTPGFLKRLNFQLVGQLDVFIGVKCPDTSPLSLRTDVQWSRVWDGPDLEWRLENPAARYQHEVFKDTVALMSPTGTFGVTAVLKLAQRPEHADLIRRAAQRRAGRGLRMWIGLVPGLRSPFLSARLPEMLKKSPLNLVFHPLQDPAATLDRRAVHLEAIDFDAY